MKLWLLDEERFVEINNLKEVTNPISFEKGMVPTEDGLFSNTIFGMNVYDRRHNWAYIDLKGHYLLPKVYITLKFLNRAFESVIYGTKTFSIQEGQLVEDENGGTGLEWLYRNWNKLEFKENDSRVRSTRIELIKSHKRDEVFTTKWAVNPAFYRDVNLSSNSSGKPKVPEINDMYSAIIRNVAIIQDGTNFDFMINSVSGKTQALLVDIYNLMKDKISGKNGYLRKAVLGKSVDYCARIVITATAYDTNSEADQHVNFYNTGVPLSHCCAQLTPFIIWWLNRFFDNKIISRKNAFVVASDNGEDVTVKLDNPEIYYNDEFIDKNLNRWINNPASRYDPIELPISDEERKKHKIKGSRYIAFNAYSYKTTTMAKEDHNKNSHDNGVLLNRPLTWTDILYMAAVEMSADKHVEITRYPLLDYLGTHFTRAHVLSTRQTIPMIVDDVLYDNYPYIDIRLPKGRIESTFIDSYKISPLYLAGLDGDYDGDQITSKFIFSKEANEDVERIMFSKSNILTIDGQSIRTIGKEGIQTLHSLTNFR